VWFFHTQNRRNTNTNVQYLAVWAYFGGEIKIRNTSEGFYRWKLNYQNDGDIVAVLERWLEFNWNLALLEDDVKAGGLDESFRHRRTKQEVCSRRSRGTEPRAARSLPEPTKDFIYGFHDVPRRKEGSRPQYYSHPDSQWETQSSRPLYETYEYVEGCNALGYGGYYYRLTGIQPNSRSYYERHLLERERERRRYEESRRYYRNWTI
jgi:hypothetical protein